MARNNTMPSLMALLGLLAVAGYQNRDKIGEWMNKQGAGGTGQPGQGGLGGLLGGLGGNLENMVNEGLGGLVDRFKQNGHGETADAWVKSGPNPEISPNGVENALGTDVIDELAKKTGLTREDLLARLSKILPQAVDQYTPEGTLPKA
ncbi:MAG: YidB family protein [Parvibaculaceae bacterium]